MSSFALRLPPPFLSAEPWFLLTAVISSMVLPSPLPWHAACFKPTLLLVNLSDPLAFSTVNPEKGCE